MVTSLLANRTKEDWKFFKAIMNSSYELKDNCNWVSKVFQDCYDFTSLHSVIGSERNSHYSLDQSDGKLKPIPTLLRVFPRFKQVACVYFEFPLVNEDVNPFYWLVVTTLVLALRSSIEICSTLQLNYFHAFRRIISILDSLWVPP